MKLALTIATTAILLAACSQGTGTPTPSPAPSPSVTPTPISVTGTWSGHLTPDGSTQPEILSFFLTDGQDGNYGGYATPDNKDTPHYPLVGNSITGSMTIQFVFGSTINLTGSMGTYAYKGNYTVSSGEKGSFEIYRNIR